MPTLTPLPTARRRPGLVWVPVTDADGRTRMEMRWHVDGDTPTGRAAAA